MWTWARRTLVGAAVLAVAFAALVQYMAARHRYMYPYGWSHSCDKNLSFALRHYADTHGGWFPRGAASPEASLSLVFANRSADADAAEILRGKTVPAEAVRERLERGELLTPETCGWHYVEGLRSDDDPDLALFWDKAGLGHNGERLTGGRFVMPISGFSKLVETADGGWEKFLAEQERLRANLKRPARLE